jgi:Flp pilus assembly protein TadB
MIILATLALMVGMGLVIRYLYLASTRRAETEAERRVRGALQRNMGDETMLAGTTAAAEQSERARPTTRAVNALQQRLENSSMLQDEEGKTFLEWLQYELMRAGLQIPPERALAITLLLWGFGLFMLLAHWLVHLPLLLALIAMGLAFYYPYYKLRALQRDRMDSIKAEVPFFIQQLHMALSSGMTTIDDAILRVSKTAEEDPYDSLLAREFAQAHTEYRLGGIDREVALRSIGRRTGVPALQNLIEALIQGLRTGAPMERVLVEYAQQAREIWRQDMRNYKNRKEPLVTLSLVCTMFGAFILYATPLALSLVHTLSALG